ncbi:YbaB/EbfC family nucleoid-associated protein [Bacillus kwashiorkori]|uniref:YbaB/EbfC family nucleoid-associated protein n=1 Tax=Bacillus kwashiorkori TaxID=1522318 RepID=UPI0007854C94|nr:YbaB/EbfC family nucleoid-associated protein [Bacillus kwashiorkori]
MRGMGNMQQMMKQMQKMQKKMQEAQEQLGEEKIEGTAGGGMVSVVVSGHKEVLEVKLDEDVVDPEDVETLQDLLVIAINDALEKVDKLTEQRLGQFTKGMNIPGLF